MYIVWVPEQKIIKITGYRSEVVRMYKDSTSSMLKKVSQVIDRQRRRSLEFEKDEPSKHFHDKDLSVDKTIPSYMYTQYPASYPANKLYPIPYVHI